MLGVLLNNQWSVGGNPLRPPVNAFLAQPFANYNMAHGWYLTTSPSSPRTGSRHRANAGLFRWAAASVGFSGWVINR